MSSTDSQARTPELTNGKNRKQRHPGNYVIIGGPYENMAPPSTYIQVNWPHLPSPFDFLHMLRRFVTPSLAIGGAAVASYYGYQLYATTALPSTFSMKTANRIPDSFANSIAVSTVNPHRHITFDDSRSVIVPVSKHLTHEHILAEF